MKRILVVLATMAAAVLLAAQNPAEAAFPGQNGKIAFDSGQDIYTINPDGSGKKQLTGSPSKDYEPAWSPSGKRIAFTREVSGKEQVLVMNANGTGTTRLTGGSSPGWSASGKRIAFERRGDLWKMRADGSNQQRLTKTPASCESNPIWSPTAKKVTFVRRDCDNPLSGARGRLIFVMNSDGTGIEVLLGSARSIITGFDWSPDGKTIVSTQRTSFDEERRYATCVTEVSSTDERTCTAHASGSGDVAGAPAFSPDGAKIVMEAELTPQMSQMNRDFSDPELIPNTDGALNPDWQPVAP